MAVIDVKESVRLKLELDGGMVGDRQITKSKIFSKVKPTAANEELYQIWVFIGLQTFLCLK